MIEFQSLVGRLLVAMPGIGDPRFEHAVILVCAHGPDHAMGLRLDRPAPMVDLKAVLAKLEVPGPASAVGRAVMIGGPVDRERGFVLHTDDWTSPDASMPVVNGLAVTGTKEALLAMTDPASGPDRAVLLLGYAGWGEGQLRRTWARTSGSPPTPTSTSSSTPTTRANGAARWRDWAWTRPCCRDRQGGLNDQGAHRHARQHL